MSFDVRTIECEAAKNGKSSVLSHLYAEFDSDSMSIQRPTAAVKSYAVTRAEITPTGFEKQIGESVVSGPLFKAHLEFELDTEVIQRIQSVWGVENKRAYTMHRSRIAAISVRRLCYTENSIRLARISQRGDWKPDPTVASAARRAWLDFEITCLHALSIGQHTYDYLKAHKYSHVAPRLLWPDLTDSQLEQLLEACRVHLSERIDEGLATTKVIHPMDVNFGQRARSPELDGDSIRSAYDVEIGRTRIVMYRGGMSGVNAFVPPEVEINAYRRALERVAKAAGFTGRVFSPVIDGGKFYVKMSEMMSNHTYAATDGSNWEINVPLIIPGILAYTYTGEVILPSGAHDTSLLGSLASLVLAYSLKGVECISIQGDDLGLFYPGRILYKDIPGISELDPLDTRYKYVLGYCYDKPDLPHSIGIKLTTDSAEFMLNRPIDSPGEPVSRGLSPQEIERWIAIYTGILPDGSSLLDALKDLPPNMELYPRTTMELIMHEHQREEAIPTHEEAGPYF